MAATGELPYPETLPVLVPGQEWRVAWDLGPWRYLEWEELTQTQHVMIRYRDARSVQHHTESVLDWSSLMIRHQWVERSP